METGGHFLQPFFFLGHMQCAQELNRFFHMRQDVDNDLVSMVSFLLFALHPFWENKHNTKNRPTTAGVRTQQNNTLSLITATFHRSKPKGAKYFHFLQQQGEKNST